MIGIQGKKKTAKRFQPFDYRNGTLVGNVMNASIWPSNCVEHVNKLVEYMNQHPGNSGYIFRTIKRG